MPVDVFGWSRVSPKNTKVHVLLGPGEVVGMVVTVVVGLMVGVIVGVGDTVGVGVGAGPDEPDE